MIGGVVVYSAENCPVVVQKGDWEEKLSSVNTSEDPRDACESLGGCGA